MDRQGDTQGHADAERHADAQGQGDAPGHAGAQGQGYDAQGHASDPECGTPSSDDAPKTPVR
jgi:hypothetical protein